MPKLLIPKRTRVDAFGSFTSTLGMATLPYLNRDLSWLSFNERVLDEADDPAVLLADRVKFLAIFSANLDEFFRVRVVACAAWRPCLNETPETAG